MSKFKPGVSGNPAGRPKGARDKVNTVVREAISGFLEKQLPVFFQTDYPKLKPEMKARFLSDLIPYDTAKLSNVSLEIQLEQLTDEQLTEIINRLKATENEIR